MSSPMHSVETIAVIGGGLAGLSAAIEAASDASVRVLLIEKEQRIGGNSAKATSGINALGSEDTGSAFEQDTLISGGNLSDPVLVHKLVHESNDALAWLTQQDPTLDLSVVSQCGGHSLPRTHRCPPRPDGTPVPVGWRLIQALKSKLESMPNVETMTNSRVKKIVLDNGRVKAIQLEQAPEQLDVNAVILTTGGFGGQTHAQQPDGSETLLSMYSPSLVNKATTNGPWANGDGVRLGVALGAATRDMDQVQVHPTGFIDPKDPTAHTKFLAPEALRAYGAILLNSQGHRFANELARRDVLTHAIFDNKPVGALSGLMHTLPVDFPAVYLILTDTMVEQFGRASVAFYASKGLFTQCHGLEALAQLVGVEEAQLRQELASYDSHVPDSDQKASPDSFGKTVFPNRLLSESGYWVALITPCVHYTMGGLVIDASASVLLPDGKPLPGLYAAGEVTGGVHGRNRLAGNSLLECVVFGRTAGCQAVRYVKS